MLARTFLRLCTLEALRPSTLLTDDGPWPTIAGAYVYDSRIAPIDDLSTGAQPVIVVYTEDDDLKKIAQSGPQIYASTVDLTFEISVLAQDTDDEGHLIVGVAYTDAELEARLDLLEAQVLHALQFSHAGRLFRKIARLPFESWKSTVQRSSEEGLKLAVRTIKAPVRVVETCTQAAPTTAPAGLNRLPAPLAEIAGQLTDSTYLAAIAAGIAAGAPVMPVVGPLNSVHMTADAKTDKTPAGAQSTVGSVAADLQG